MEHTYFFYDVESSGLDKARQRIVQFAGQRTDMALLPIGEPVNVIVALHDDVLPDPASVRVNGFAPQDLAGGISEPEFCRLLLDEVFTPGTIAAGYNNIRFDDNFIRHLLWRNFHPPYEWGFRQGRGRFDVYNLALAFRALRPEGIVWPTREDGSPSSTLGDLCAANGLQHEFRHDALDDILATIELARLLRDSNPRLFAHFMSLRERKPLEAFVSSGKPFLYVHPHFGAERHHAGLVVPIYKTARGEMMVYDLSEDPQPFLGLSDEGLALSLFGPREEREERGLPRLPVRRLRFNRNPGVAPLSVATQQGPGGDALRERLSLDLEACNRHFSVFTSPEGPAFFARVKRAFDEQTFPPADDVEDTLYDGKFPTGADERRCEEVVACPLEGLADCNPEFDDARYAELLLRYKARNAPGTLTSSEREAWEAHRRVALTPTEQWLTDWKAERAAAEQAGDHALLGRLNALRDWADRPSAEPALL